MFRQGIQVMAPTCLLEVKPVVGGSYYNCQLDDTLLFNYALTPTQIKLLYNQNSAVRLDQRVGGRDACRIAV